MSLLKKKCRNYYYSGVKLCVLVEVPILDYSKLDSELARLEKQEANTNKAKAEALDTLLVAQAKKDHLCKQRKMLKRYKQKQINKSRKYVEEIKALEVVKDINCKVAHLEDSMMPSTLALDQSVFMPTYLGDKPKFANLDFKYTTLVASGSS